MGYTIKETVVLETDVCASCGVVFAMPDSLMAKRRQDGGSFSCPNGHSLIYGNSLKEQNKKLKERLEGETRRLEAQRRETEHVRANLEVSRRQTAAQKGQVTKLKNRAANGTCPCCNRYFANLHRHMQTKHPDFVAMDEEVES